jgi:hypothetical protein
MNQSRFLICALLLCCTNLPFARCGDIVRREEVRKTLTFTSPPGAPRRLVVDNISGSIHVVGTNGDEVTLVARETFRAESEERIAIAKEKIRLEISSEPDRIRLYVDAPWRCPDGSFSSHGHGNGWEYYGYDATFDFELSIPSKTDLSLKTVNGGEIEVKNAEGSFLIENVNGGIVASGLNGSGTISTVNGNIDARFTRNPAASSSFRTVNGEVNVSFQDDLSADLRLKTMNGEVYTDFQVSSLPPAPPSRPEHERKRVYRTADSFLVRVGSGGPDLSFNTLNGNIYIVKNQ